jgi:hypothetical protein
VQADLGGGGHGPPFPPAEGLVQRFAADGDGRAADKEPLQRSLIGLGVDPLMVDLMNPGIEQRIELGQVRHGCPCPRDSIGDLDEELVSHGPEETLDLPSALRSSGLGMGKFRTDHRAGPAQCRVHEHTAVVNIDDARAPA